MIRFGYSLPDHSSIMVLESKDSLKEKLRAIVKDPVELGGGFILSPSDHFFDADLNYIHAFADEGRKCDYQKNQEV